MRTKTQAKNGEQPTNLEAKGEPTGNGFRVVETKDAYDQARLDRLDCRDLRDAIEFDTELKDTFGMAWLDDEARIPLLDALERVQTKIEDGGSTPAGIAATALKTLMKGHLRGFGRYYSGKDPWPRPSEVVRAEIDRLMPFGLQWLRHELEEALSEEADNAAELAGGVADHSGGEATEVSGAPAERHEAVATLRVRSEEPDPTYGRIMVAIDRRHHSGSPGSLTQETKDYYVSCLRQIRNDGDLFEAGGIIWDQTGIDLPMSGTANLLELKAVDPILHRAIHATFLGLMVTTVGPVDLESAAHVLGTFLRVHPYFADVVKRGSWQLPFGEHTAYRWAELADGEPAED